MKRKPKKQNNSDAALDKTLLRIMSQDPDGFENFAEYLLENELLQIDLISKAAVKARKKRKLPTGRKPIVQAREDFVKHWRGAITNAGILLKQGDEYDKKLVCDRALYLMFQTAFVAKHGDSTAGHSFFILANNTASSLVKIAADGPAWLMKEFRKERSTAWLMEDGSPVAGYPQHTLTKRGKNQFEALQTRAVAEAIHYFEFWRTFFEGRSAEWIRAHDNRETDFDIPLKYASRLSDLNPLAKSTMPDWWPLIKARIEENDELIEMGISHCKPRGQHSNAKTPAQVRSDFIDRCYKALKGLCPPD